MREKGMLKRNILLIIFIGLALSVSFLLTGCCSPVSNLDSSNTHVFVAVKNIIIMIPDGMGLSDVTAARIYKNGPNGNPLSFETLENIGYQRTHSANSTVTDSAAAASAWACGEKFNNGEICYHSKDGSYNPTVLELAKYKGKATGLVATSTITHATPAAWASHVNSRSCETEIAKQYIENTGVDVMLGGGRKKFNPDSPDDCGARGNFIEIAKEKGYTVVYKRSEMGNAVNSGAKKLLGLFADEALTPEKDRSSDTEEPRLPEMTSAALTLLEKNRNGFFLMVEGSQVDSANHNNDLEYQITETLAFDEAVKVVLDWINTSSRRKSETLLIVVADHETGGFAVSGPYGRLSEAGELIEAGWTSKNHTAQDTIVWSQGPGSYKLGRAIDNTALYYVMKEALGYKVSEK